MAEKISVYSLNDLKLTTDDSIPTYLTSATLKPPFKPSHNLSNVRLALGYLALLLASLTFYWDYTYTFEKTKTLTTISVLLYMLVNGALTLWIWGVERNTVFVGKNVNGEKIEIATSVKKFTPVYDMTIRTFQGKGKQGGKAESREIKISRPFTEWFDEKGHFVPLPFQRMLVENVPLIAAVDRREVVRLSAAKPSAEASKVSEAPVPVVDVGMLEAAGYLAGSSPDGATPRKGKGKKKA